MQNETDKALEVLKRADQYFIQPIQFRVGCDATTKMHVKS